MTTTAGCGRFAITSKAKSNDKYHRILDAAIKVFAEEGFYRATVAAVAREAGVADGTIYLYFKNKDDILLQFFSYKTQQVFDRFREVVQESEHATDKLRNLIRRHLEEFQNNPHMAVVFQNEGRQCFNGERYIKGVAKMYLDLVSEILEKGQAEGIVRRDLYIGLVKRFIMGAVDEVINTWVLAERKYDLVSMGDPLVNLYFYGIGMKS